MQIISWVFPMVSASCWLTTLFTMLGHWAMIGEPTYARMKPGQTIPYISDIAATELKPVFISGSVITMLCLNISFYQFVQIKGNANKFCTYISCLFAVIGSLGLIMLSAFDNLDHQYMHDSFVTIFIVGYLISAAVICVDYFYLTISHGLHQRMLIASFMIKLSFVIIELAFILAFRITARGSYIHKDTAAVLEWVHHNSTPEHRSLLSSIVRHLRSPKSITVSQSYPTGTVPTKEKTFSAFNKDQGHNYAQGRPGYSPRLYQSITDTHTTTGGQLDTVLDVGCGPGNATRGIGPYFAHAIGLDPSEGMMATARTLGAHVVQRRMRIHPSVPNGVAIQAAVDELGEMQLMEFMELGNLLTRGRYVDIVLPWTLDRPVPAFDRDAFIRQEWEDADEFYADLPPVTLDMFEKMITTTRVESRTAMRIEYNVDETLQIWAPCRHEIIVSTLQCSYPDQILLLGQFQYTTRWGQKD
ncbi:uncharacterized protein N7459_008427 [Penicillium hispanicum]|uniref:uncharacterized protein n=1 Tax=Penicillium hispanicum TaxID=1080232 RepID=UPI00253F9D03|nr:uncharacterized protein N7459_008427 [Penicillium hispanicum]KAJ5574000.1 hypothetical protein N7459_008427 [Penicillium hispanicum]